MEIDVKQRWTWLALAVLMVLAIPGGFWLKRQLDWDACLDAGGRWLHSTSSCSLE